MILSCFCVQANAEDTSLEALITAGRADIATGQATVETLLEKIIGEQHTAAAAEAAAASALAAIESLTTEQEAATASIATAYTTSLTSIEVSTVSRNSASSVLSSALATLVFALSSYDSHVCMAATGCIPVFLVSMHIVGRFWRLAWSDLFSSAAGKILIGSLSICIRCLVKEGNLHHCSQLLHAVSPYSPKLSLGSCVLKAPVL